MNILERKIKKDLKEMKIDEECATNQQIIDASKMIQFMMAKYTWSILTGPLLLGGITCWILQKVFAGAYVLHTLIYYIIVFLISMVIIGNWIIEIVETNIDNIDDAELGYCHIFPVCLCQFGISILVYFVIGIIIFINLYFLNTDFGKTFIVIETLFTLLIILSMISNKKIDKIKQNSLNNNEKSL